MKLINYRNICSALYYWDKTSKIKAEQIKSLAAVQVKDCVTRLSNGEKSVAAARRNGQNGHSSPSENHFKLGVDQSDSNTYRARAKEVQTFLKLLLLAKFFTFQCVLVVGGWHVWLVWGSSTLSCWGSPPTYCLVAHGSVLQFVNSFWSCCLNKIYFRYTWDQLGHATASKWTGDMQQGLIRSKAGVINASKCFKMFQVRQDEEALRST